MVPGLEWIGAGLGEPGQVVVVSDHGLSVLEKVLMVSVALTALGLAWQIRKG